MTGVTLVTGSDGVLGRAVVDALAARGLPVRGLGRRAAPDGFPAEWVQGDLLTGAGLPAALDGVDAVINCASDFSHPDSDVATLRRLLAAIGLDSGIHLVQVGVAGIERAAAVLPYYAAKLACERIIADSGVSYTIARAIQFHPFVDRLFRTLRVGPLLLVPRKVTLQPVAVEFVAAQLVDHAHGVPVGRAPDIHGPERRPIGGLGRDWLTATARRGLVWEVPLPMKLTRALALLEPAHGVQGGATWREWLGLSGPATDRTDTVRA